MRRTLNIGILAHADAGKTTLTEELLYRSGALRTRGRVDSADTASDTLAYEREHGISVEASTLVMCEGEAKVNIIDTPGHVDFVSEVERSLLALDMAVLVVSAAEGVQAQTRALARALARAALPTVIFINKCDRPCEGMQSAETRIEELFSLRCVHADIPRLEGTRQVYVESTDTDRLCSELADIYDDIAEAYLEGRAPGERELRKRLYEGARRGELLCVLYGAALRGAGVEELRELLFSLCADREDTPEEPAGVVYKVYDDRAYVRLYSGKLESRDEARVGESGETRKVTRVERVWRGAPQISALRSGDVGIVYGLGAIAAGESIGDAPKRAAALATPVMRVSISAEDPAKANELVRAVETLTREDPMLRCRYIKEISELSVEITGKMQCEVLKANLKSRFALDCVISSPTIIYKESVKHTARGFAEYTMPKPCWAIVGLRVSPLPRGSGVVIDSVAEDRYIMRRYQNHVMESLRRCVEQGLFGWEVTDVHFTLTDGQHHLIHTHPMDFFLCTPMAYMDALTNAEVVLLEPMLRMRMSGGKESASRVLSALSTSRARIEKSEREGDGFMIEAVVPAAESMDFPALYASLTGGTGVLESAFEGYEEAPGEVRAQRARIGVDPRDRAKWILANRNAL